MHFLSGAHHAEHLRLVSAAPYYTLWISICLSRPQHRPLAPSPRPQARPPIESPLYPALSETSGFTSTFSPTSFSTSSPESLPGPRGRERPSLRPHLAPVSLKMFSLESPVNPASRKTSYRPSTLFSEVLLRVLPWVRSPSAIEESVLPRLGALLRSPSARPPLGPLSI